MAEPILSYRDVTLRREECDILKSINLDIYAGEFVYLTGKVGAGKSTLLKSIYCDIPITSGEARFMDHDLTHIKRKRIPYLRRDLGVIFQDFQLLPDRTVYKNLEFVLKATGWRSTKEIDERITQVLKQVGLEHKGYRMPHELSGGEQQRIVISRALLNAPVLIMADEPTGHLDPDTSVEILELLRSIATQGTAVLMSTHNYALIQKYPARILRIEGDALIEVTLHP